MGEKYRNVMRTPWTKVIDRDFSFCECPELDGVCSLIHLIKITGPLYCTYSDGVPVTIIKDGCFWLQFAPRSEKYWLTALFDERGDFDHAYFDMTEYNEICGKNTYFCDMYLDVAIKKDGSVFVLDEDELLAALNDKVITQAQFDDAYKTADRVTALYGGENVKKLISLCEKYFKVLMPKLTERRVFEMNLLPEPFEAIKSGKKTVELRLNDEKRRELSVGDIINFSCGDNVLSVKVIDLYKERDFITLFEKYSMTEMGFSEKETPQSGAMQMRKYYSVERENECGVLGIKIKKI